MMQNTKINAIASKLSLEQEQSFNDDSNVSTEVVSFMKERLAEDSQQASSLRSQEKGYRDMSREMFLEVEKRKQGKNKKTNKNNEAKDPSKLLVNLVEKYRFPKDEAEEVIELISISKAGGPEAMQMAAETMKQLADSKEAQAVKLESTVAADRQRLGNFIQSASKSQGRGQKLNKETLLALRMNDSLYREMEARKIENQWLKLEKQREDNQV